jgi:hypothetical protein
MFLCYIARINDDNPEYEQDYWKKTNEPSEADEQLRADRWYYNSMDGRETI